MLMDGRMQGWMDGWKVITIAHPEHSSGELKRRVFFRNLALFSLFFFFSGV